MQISFAIVKGFTLDMNDKCPFHQALNGSFAVSHPFNSLGFCTQQGGRSWGTAGPAVHDRSGSSTKGRTPNIRYFVTYFVAIYALVERLS